MSSSSDLSEDKKVIYDVDVKSVEGQEAAPVAHTSLHRNLKNRHIAMISIGGVIGTGLFLGTAGALRNGGPLGILLAYLFIGSICFTTMLSLGEMVAFLPIAGGFVKLAERFVDPALAFAIGWNYLYGGMMTLPAELSAASAIIQFWDKETSPAIWIAMCLTVAIMINGLGVGAYGEAEFWFSSIKVITITGMIILGIIIDLGGGPSHDRIGFRYWKDPGPFTDFYGFTGAKGHFLGTCSVTIQAAFSYLGTETVAITAAEAKNPRRNIPKAIKRVFYRILLFYIGGVLIIGLLVPSNNPLLNLNSHNASASPFVIAFTKAGIKTLPSVINGAILTSAWSASSSDLYISSRILYSLAISGSAPKIFARTTRSGLPYVAVALCSCFGLLAFMTLGASSGIAFTWLSNFSSTTGLITWLCIGVTYLRFYQGMKAQGISRRTLPFAPRVQPFAGWWTVCGTGLLLFFSAWKVFLKGHWDMATFVTNYTPIFLFPVLYFAAKMIMRARTISASKMDFVSNVAEFDAMTFDDPPPRNFVEKFWQWMM